MISIARAYAASEAAGAPDRQQQLGLVGQRKTVDLGEGANVLRFDRIDLPLLTMCGHESQRDGPTDAT
jgi:hypothetical protein